MKLKLTLVSGTEHDDIVVTVDATATVGQLAERLRVSHPRVRAAAVAGPSLCLRVHPGTPSERTIDPNTTMADAAVRSGDAISLTNAAGGASGLNAPVATMTVISGPDAGRSFPLPAGNTLIGRDRSCDIRLSDPLVSKRHAKVNVTDMVEMIDDNSANGIVVDGEPVQRVVLRPSDRAKLGDTTVSITLHHASGSGGATGGHAIEFNRSPRLDPKYEGIELVAPEPPTRPNPQRFPIITIIAPLFMGAIMYSVTKNALSILFVGLSPIMAIGSFYENRWATKKALQLGAANFRASLRDLAVQLQYAAELERNQRRREHPSVDEIAAGVHELSSLVWTRRPEHESFGQIRLGLGSLPSRNSIKLPSTNNTLPELWRELNEVARQFVMVDRVPVVAVLAATGSVGVAGPSIASHPLAAALVGQLAGLHSPSELVLGCIATSTSAPRWEWMKWLPHVGSDHSPLETDHMATATSSIVSLISAIEDVIDVRSGNRASDAPAPLPRVVLVVEDDAALDRARLVQIAERGRTCAVHLIWVAASLERIPAPCRTYLEVDPNSGEGRAGFVQGGVGVSNLELEPLTPEVSAFVARRLAALVDSGALLEDDSDLPRSVSFLAIGGTELADSVDEVIQRWDASNSLPPAAGAARLKRDNSLRALVGQSATDRFYLDLRTNGPHALVGGTTGAGKSEFLQSWIIGMAAAHSPTRVNFLFVDYKGGAAFADCVNLPHCVGLVTDLSPHLVRRALRSLNAELRHREHVLNRKKAKDLLELERRRDPEAPPSLVIVVDEFAALVSEVPEFVDGVVNVAQRGRSLGLHLILATQRPAGVIKGNLRANTNLRVALRMADEGDSDDVIGTAQAAGFDPAIPGRGVAKTGPGRLTQFQAAYIGGHTSDVVPTPIIDVNEFRFGLGSSWDAPTVEADEIETPLGPNDISRVVTTIGLAATTAALPEPRKPWLAELAATYRLEDLPTARTDHELIFGVVDQPDDQAQPVVGFVPDRDGNMAVFGTGGSGKSTLLRTLTVAAGFAPARGGPCSVYALDFGSRGLQMLEDMPHVGAVINGDDNERIIRLLRYLKSTIDERAERYAKVSASTIQEYRERSGSPGEARILVLVDGFGAFRQAYELGPQSRLFETFLSIAADGRSVGIHVIVTADRPASVPASLSSAIQKRLVLRMANEMDYAVVGVAMDALSSTSPPGRGFIEDAEVQVGVLGGDSNVARQAAAIGKLGKAMERAGVNRVDRIERLPERVAASTLPSVVDGKPLLGVWDETLGPIGFEPVGTFLVAGPPQSGKTTTVAAMVAAILRQKPSTPFALFGSKRSPLGAAIEWHHRATTPDEMEILAESLTKLVADEDPSVAGLVVVIESISDLLNGSADMPLQGLLKACRALDHFVIAESESGTLGSSWPLLQAAKASRTGIALQPEQLDGDSIFKTAFPRVQRAEFPPGRGFYVRAGKAARVQVALPE